MTEGKTVVLLLLIAFAWIGIVHVIDRLIGILFLLRMKRRVNILMERHRVLSDKYEREMLLDEIDGITACE